MQPHKNINFFLRICLVLLLGMAFNISVYPIIDHAAFAKNGGNGGGNGGGKGEGGGKGGGSGGKSDGGTGSSSSGNGKGSSGPVTDTDTGVKKGKPVKDTTVKGKANKTTTAKPVKEKAKANTAGKLNGFLNASPKAIQNASPNSAIGKVAQAVKDALAGYAVGTATVDDVAAALAEATNKPVTPEQVVSVIDKLSEASTDGSLEGYHDGTLDKEALAKDIADKTNELKDQESTESAQVDDAAETNTSDASGAASTNTP